MTLRRSIVPVFLCIFALTLSAFDIFRGRRDTMYQSALRAHAPAIVLHPGIFVSTLGSDGNAGTNYRAPVRSLAAALQRVSQYGATNIYVAKGLYSRGSGIAAGTDGVTITGFGMNFIGGWENDFFSRSTTERSVLDGGNAAFRVMLIANAQTIRMEGFSIVRGGTTTLSGGGIAIMHSTGVLLTNLLVMSNSGYNGGGMHVSNCTGVTIASSCYFSNHAQNYGGALMCVQSGIIGINDTLMLNGNGVGHAGGMHALLSSNITASNLSILSNNGGSGAAISLDQTTNTTFIRLTASSNATASQVIYLNIAGSCTFRDSFITNNANSGNLLLLANARSLTVANCMLAGNGATTYGIQELSPETGQTFLNNSFKTGSLTTLYHDTVTGDASFSVDATGMGNFNNTANTGAAVSSGNVLY